MRPPLRIHSLGSLLIAALLSLSVAPASAHWTHTAAPSTVFAGTGTQTVTSVSDGQGGVVMAWLDNSPGIQKDLYAQRLGPDGSVLWGAGGVAVTTLSADVNEVVIAADGSGGVFLAWADDRAGVGDFAVFAQYLNAAGVAQWTTDGVAVTSGAGIQFDTQIIADGTGGVVVGWVDTRAGNQDVYAQRLSSAGAALWTAGGLAIVSLAPSNQNTVRLAPFNAVGGIGGAGFVWQDFRLGTSDVYYQVVNAAGTPLLAANGVVVCNAANNQSPFSMVSTGALATVAWTDQRVAGNQDIYAQRIRMDVGSMTWLANGVGVCTAALTQLNPRVVLEANTSLGFSVIAWTDGRNGNNDVYAQRLNSLGTAQWAANGVAVIGTTPTQVFEWIDDDDGTGTVITWRDFTPVTFSDVRVQHLDSNGSPLWNSAGVSMGSSAFSSLPQAFWIDTDNTFVVWSESRPGGEDVFANRVERFGYAGDPGPVIASAQDVPHDQGGALKLSWFPSYLDVFPSFGIASYRIWRSVPVDAAQAAIARGARVTSIADEAERTRALLARPASEATATIFWEHIGTQPAIGLPGYSFVVPMPFDSLPGVNPYTPFMVEARTSGVAFWLSEIDSGYSVDNLAPPAPAPFAGTYASGTASLHWAPVTVADFAHYRLYRGSSSGFVPGPGNLVASPTDTAHADAAGSLFWYKVSALDVHGNESPFSVVLPSSAAGVGDDLAGRLELAAPSPMPARDRTIVRFTLPAAGPARLEVLDVTGRRVAVLRDGPASAGAHAIAWDLAAGGARLGHGLYWIRLRAAGETLSRRLVIAP